MRRHDAGDPQAALWFLDALARGCDAVGPSQQLDPGLSYLASHLRLHVTHRIRANASELETCEAQHVACWREVAERLEHLAQTTEALEQIVGELVISRERRDRGDLFVQLVRVREQLLRVNALDIDAAMQTHWVDIGGEG